MPPLRILIAQIDTDILATALAEAVRADPRRILCSDAVIVVADLDEYLLDPASRPHVLVLVGEDPLLDAQVHCIAPAHRELIVLAWTISPDTSTSAKCRSRDIHIAMKVYLENRRHGEIQTLYASLHTGSATVAEAYRGAT